MTRLLPKMQINMACKSRSDKDSKGHRTVADSAERSREEAIECFEYVPVSQFEGLVLVANIKFFPIHVSE